MDDLETFFTPTYPFFPDDHALELIAQHVYINARDVDLTLEAMQLESLPPEVLHLQHVFGLTIFECHVLLACRIPKLNARLALYLAMLNFNDAHRQPTPATLLRLFSFNHPVDRRSFRTNAPLLRYGLVIMDGADTGEPQLYLTLRLEHYLDDELARVPGSLPWSDIDSLLRRAQFEAPPPALTTPQNKVLERMRRTFITRDLLDLRRK
jgi:hypothetical protein